MLLIALMVVTIILIFLFVMYFHYQFALWLKENHREKWKEVGSPFKNDGAFMDGILFGFGWMPLKKSHYEKIEDPELEKLREWALIASWCGTIVILTILFLYFLASYFFG